MMWTLFFSLAQARDGTGIGILGPVPEEPASVRPTYGRGEGRDMARVSEPELLVPVGFDSSRGNFWERYYDETGQVWRYREVESILSGQASSSEYIADARRKRRVGYTLGIVGEIFFPNTLGCCVSDGAMMYAYYESEQSRSAALTAYNLRNQHPVIEAEPAAPD